MLDKIRKFWSIFLKIREYHLLHYLVCNGKNQYKKKKHNQHITSVQSGSKQWSLVYLCEKNLTLFNFISPLITVRWYLLFIFFFAVKRLMIIKNSVVEIQNFIVNQKSQPTMLNLHNFHILVANSNQFKLILKESLLIKCEKPILNKTIKSFLLELFH